MASARTIKRRINTAGNIAKITKAMEMVSASKMRRAQDQALASRAYARAIHDSLHAVAALTDASHHPLLSSHTDGDDVLVIYSTDRGLCGGLNTHLFKSTLAWLKEHKNAQIIAIGKKAVAFARKTSLPLFAQFVSLPEKVGLSDVVSVSSMVTEGFLEHKFRSVAFIYMDFINTLTQKVRIAHLLPLHDKLEKVTSDSDTVPMTEMAQYIFEPSPQDILNDLLPYYIEHTLYQTLLEAKASEHSARMVAMKNASDNARDLVGELRLLYNKSRQASITNELLDITTATLTVTD